jgi:hypothetical protein
MSSVLLREITLHLSTISGATFGLSTGLPRPEGANLTLKVGLDSQPGGD